MTVVPLAAVAAHMRTRPAVGEVRLVGVDGPAGTGKSTLANRLAALLDDAPVAHTDDFCGWTNLAGWWPEFIAEVITPLLAGHDARYRARDWIGDEFGMSRKDWKTTPAAPFVLIEGVTATRREFASALSYAIWVWAPAELRLQRGLDRDGESRRPQWDAWMAAERAFFGADRAVDRADLWVTTASAAPHDPKFDLVSLSGPVDQ